MARDMVEPGGPTAATIVSDLERGRWLEVADAIDGIADPDERSFLIEIMADLPGWPAWLDAWSGGRPDAATTSLVRGAYGIRFAARARAEQTAGGEAAHQQVLKEASADLESATRLAPDDPVPWEFSVALARVSELGLDEIARCFSEAVARSPFNRYGHAQLLESLAPKWGGTAESMFEFARGASAAAPDGHGLHALIAQAHIEQWVWSRREPAPGADPEPTYFRDASVQEELLAAARRSVLSPNATRGRRTPQDLNLFAFAFWLARLRVEATAAFDAIGDAVTDLPWAYFPAGPAATFARARAEVSA